MKEGYILGGGGGPDLDVITATAADVRSGKVIVDKDGNPLTGTEPERGNWTGSVEMNGKIIIPNGHHGGGGYVNGPAVTQRGAWNGAVGMNGKVTIPEGYHNGLGSVGGPSVPYQNADVSGTDRAYATGISAWSGVMCLGVRSGYYLNGVNWIHGNIPNLIPENIKKNVNIAGLIGKFEGPVSSPYYLIQNGYIVNLTSKTLMNVGDLRDCDPEQGVTQGNITGLRIWGGNYWQGTMLSESINTSNHKYLKADIGYTGSTNGGIYLGVGFMTLGNANAVTADNSGNSTNLFSKFSAYVQGAAYSGQTIVADISSLSGNYFLVIVVRYPVAGYTAVLSVKNVYLTNV